MDDARHPVPDNLGLIWFCHVIGGPMRQGRHLIRLAVALRRDNHRDGGQGRIGLRNRQERISIHHRHGDVQQNQGNLILSFLQNIEGLLPVFRFQNRIFQREQLT